MTVRKTATIERLETLRSRHSMLNERHAKAQSALDQARADQRRFFLESDVSDDKAITKAENAVDAAMLRLSSLSNACETLAAEVVVAEERLASEVDRENRKAAAKVLADRADAMQERLQTMLRDCDILSKDFAAIIQLMFDANQFSNLFFGVARKVELALDVTPSQLRGLAKAVENGEAEIPEVAISAAAESRDDVRSR
jgi:hypothetical protein